MEHRIEIAPLAILQSEEVRERIAERSPAQAARWERRFFETIESIRKMPRRCPVVPEETERFGEEVRELLCGKRRNIYRILYTIRGDVIRVVAIRHGSRGPD